MTDSPVAWEEKQPPAAFSGAKVTLKYHPAALSGPAPDRDRAAGCCLSVPLSAKLNDPGTGFLSLGLATWLSCRLCDQVAATDRPLRPLPSHHHSFCPAETSSRGMDPVRAGMIETLHSPFSNSTEAGGMMYSFASQQDAAADAAR